MDSAYGIILSEVCSLDPGRTGVVVGYPHPPFSEGWGKPHRALSFNVPELRVLVLRLQKMKANYRLKAVGCWW